MLSSGKTFFNGKHEWDSETLKGIFTALDHHHRSYIFFSDFGCVFHIYFSTFFHFTYLCAILYQKYTMKRC